MALFTTTSKKKTSKKSSAKAGASKAGASAVALADSRLETVLKAPWMSEKALIATEQGVYVFAVPAEATKTQIARAIERIYKVVPRKVNVVNLPGKSKALRSKHGFGRRAARHKAYVYLKKGETIQF